MRARLRMSEPGYGTEPQPTGEIEVWDGDDFAWRPAKPDEIVPSLIEIVTDLYRWKLTVTKG